MIPRGRFAPSPTGPLHRGSVVAAVGSFLDARSRGGEWLVRIDDADRARCRQGASDAILTELERLGLHWDGEPTRQVGGEDRYRAALDRLHRDGHTFRCACTRREVGPGLYPGTCRDGPPPGREPRSVRLRVGTAKVTLRDAITGHYQQSLATEVGDFVVLRADGVVAYHLGTVVDDAEACISHVVRGADLLESTPRQIFLGRCLELPEPSYAHLPVVIDGLGHKLSKQTGAGSTSALPAVEVIRASLVVLGHSPPPDLGNLPELLDWGVRAWDATRVPTGTARWPEV